MSTIYDTNNSFVFNKIVLSKPVPLAGGSYFIRCTINNEPIYIQPPRCCTKQGILKAGKRFYTDMMFGNVNADFIQWMEKLEEHCQSLLYENRESWFDGEMEKHDIENYFTPPLKIYKSGKFYLARVNVPSVLGKLSIKIYDEDENELEMDVIDETTSIMTILEIKGIKCSATCFQIEMEIKQLLVMKATDVFSKCMIRSNVNHVDDARIMIAPTQAPFQPLLSDPITQHEIDNQDSPESEPVISRGSEPSECLDKTKLDHNSSSTIQENTIEMNNTLDHSDSVITDTTVVSPTKKSLIVENTQDSMNNQYTNELEEIDVHLDDLPIDNNITIKNRKDVYYQMYYEARRKATRARDLALSSYLEAKRIKNTYMLDDIHSSDNSGSDTESDPNE